MIPTTDKIGIIGMLLLVFFSVNILFTIKESDIGTFNLIALTSLISAALIISYLYSFELIVRETKKLIKKD